MKPGGETKAAGEPGAGEHARRQGCDPDATTNKAIREVASTPSAEYVIPAQIVAGLYAHVDWMRAEFLAGQLPEVVLSFDVPKWHLLLHREFRELPLPNDGDDPWLRLEDELFRTLHAGELDSLPPDEVDPALRAWAEPLRRDPRLLRVALLAGRMKRIAAAKRLQRVKHGADETAAGAALRRYAAAGASPCYARPPA